MTKKNPFMKEPPFAIQAADQDEVARMFSKPKGKGKAKAKGGKGGFMKALENASKKRPGKRGKR